MHTRILSLLMFMLASTPAEKLPKIVRDQVEAVKPALAMGKLIGFSSSGQRHHETCVMMVS